MVEKEFVRVSISDLIPYDNNPRKNDNAVPDVAESIKQCGDLDPIEIDENNVILAGHTRLMALMEQGFTETDVIRYTGLTEEQKKKYRILSNKTGEKALWDFDALAEELEGLDFDDYDFGFDLDFDGHEEPTEIEEDEIPEEVETRCKIGDLWQLGEHFLICGDSTNPAVIDRLMDGVKADCVFTDPPYQLDTQGGGILKSANSMKQIKQNGVDSFDPSRLTMWSETNIFCHNKPLIKAYIELAENNGMPYDLAFYKKKNTVPNYKGHLMTDVEYIAIIGKQDPNKGLEKEMYSKCFIGQKDNDNELSYSKPVALCAKYIQLYSKKTVLDLFGGSGSTLIACEQLNRKCYMCELDEHYCDVIIERWENFTGKAAVKVS